MNWIDIYLGIGMVLLTMFLIGILLACILQIIHKIKRK